MESSTILTADVLDIIFEGRNKDYGAYDLRRTYSKRLTVSITVMLSAIGIVTMSFAFTGKKEKAAGPIIIDEVTLATAPEKPEKPVELPPPPVKPPAPPIQVRMAAFVAPRIVQDDQVKPDEMPPANETLNDVKIGNKNVLDGLNDDGTVIAPPGDVQGNVIEMPKKEEENWEKTWTKVEIPSEYPGGPAAWMRYLNKNLRFSQEAIDNEVEGTVVVQFIVDKEGNVSDVESIGGPMELRAEAVRVIKKSGRWTPAIQNGHQVKTLKSQSIVFRLDKEG